MINTDYHLLTKETQLELTAHHNDKYVRKKHSCSGPNSCVYCTQTRFFLSLLFRRSFEAQQSVKRKEEQDGGRGGEEGGNTPI